MMLRVVKELGTARLRRSQTALQAVTPELVQLLGAIYTERTSCWLELLTKPRDHNGDAHLAMHNSLTCLKTLRRLLIVGYERPHDEAMAREFWSLSQSQFGQFLGLVGQDSPVPTSCQDLVGKYLLQFTKLHLEMCEAHAASFAVLPDSIPLARAYWDLVANFAEVFDKSGGIKQATGDGPGAKSKTEGPLLEKLALRGLLLLRSCIAIVFYPAQTFKYRSLKDREHEVEAVNMVKANLLTDEFVLSAVNTIITRLFIFRQTDLDAWEEDPEEWEAQERDQGNAWEWEVRPCAERVLLDLLIHHKGLLTPPMLSYFQAAAKADSSIITKEAVYTAMGCAAAVIYEDYDFDSFLAFILTSDVRAQDPLAKVLRRRIAILISQWVTVRIDAANRPVAYEIFRHLMDPNDNMNDQVVRITAARQFRIVADDLGFDGEQFLPFASDVFGRLIELIWEVSLDDTRLAILDTIRVIVSRMDTHVSQFGNAIMALLPRLWDSTSTEEYMIKQSTLAIATALVLSMGRGSQRYEGILIPLLAEAMNPESALHLHLIDESVELWKAMVERASPPLSDDMTKLLVLALPLLEYDSEVAEECSRVVKNYAILAPEAVLNDSLRRPTLAALVKAMDSRNRSKVQVAELSLEAVLKMASWVGGSQGVSVVVQDLHELGFIRAVLEGLRSSWEASQSVGPNRVASKINTVVETFYFAILARVALADPALFINMLASFGPGGAVQPVWAWLMAEWFSHFDSMAEISQQKLSCLALTRICELPGPMQDLVLGKLQDYLSMWTSVVMQLRDLSSNSTGDALVWDDSTPAYDELPPAERLELQFEAKDALHAVVAFDFIKARLQDLVRRAGGEQQFESDWAANVDKEVLDGFKRLNEP